MSPAGYFRRHGQARQAHRALPCWRQGFPPRRTARRCRASRMRAGTVDQARRGACLWAGIVGQLGQQDIDCRVGVCSASLLTSDAHR